MKNQTLFIRCTILSILCLTSLLNAYADNFACNYQGQKGYYDLSPLSSTQISGVQGTTWTYYLQMCGVATGTSGKSCTSLSGPMVCQVYNSDPTNNVFTLAYPSDQIKTHVWTELNTGIQLTAYGDLSTGCTPGLRSANINIMCDATATSVPTTFDEQVSEESSCVYDIYITHASGCPGAAPSGSGGSGGISGGTVFLIVILVSAFVYVAGGCFYKRYKKGTTGLKESCPNNEFWFAIPGLVKDGCIFTVHKLRSLCGGSSSTSSGGTGSYENI